MLNTELRKLLTLCLAASVAVRVIWVSTGANPTDAPSRGVALPEPGPLPKWVTALYDEAHSHCTHAQTCTPCCTTVPCRVPLMPDEKVRCKQARRQYAHARRDDEGEETKTSSEGESDEQTSRCRQIDGEFREYYSGYGRLARSMRRRGFCAKEYEAFHSGKFDPSFDLGDPEVVDREIVDVKAGRVRSAHFGIVCSSWCRMSQRFNGGTRTNTNPYGTGAKLNEIAGNTQVAQMKRLIDVLVKHDVPFTIENPIDSLIWHTAELRAIRSFSNVTEVSCDQCMFKLRPPEWTPDSLDYRIRKRTRLLGTVKGLESLARSCDGEHIHVEAWGHVRVNGKRISRAKAAGAYPPALCNCLANFFAQHLAQ